MARVRLRRPPFIGLLLNPAAMPSGAPAALACRDRRRAAIAAADDTLLGPLAAFARPMLAGRALGDRNAMRAPAVEHAGDGTAVTDGEGRFLNANPACYGLFGFETEAEALRCDCRQPQEASRAAMLELVALPASPTEGCGDAKGLEAAARRVSCAAHQRCRALARDNALVRVPAKQRTAVAAMLKTSFARGTKTINTAKVRLPAVASWPRPTLAESRRFSIMCADTSRFRQKMRRNDG